MTIKKQMENEKITFIVDGKLTTATSPQFQDALIPAISEADEVALDFAGLELLSSAGIRVLLMGEKAAKAAGKSMIIKNAKPIIIEIFEITGLESVFTIMRG